MHYIYLLKGKKNSLNRCIKINKSIWSENSRFLTIITKIRRSKSEDVKIARQLLENTLPQRIIAIRAEEKLDLRLIVNTTKRERKNRLIITNNCFKQHFYAEFHKIMNYDLQHTQKFIQKKSQINIQALKVTCSLLFFEC